MHVNLCGAKCTTLDDAVNLDAERELNIGLVSSRSAHNAELHEVVEKSAGDEQADTCRRVVEGSITQEVKSLQATGQGWNVCLRPHPLSQLCSQTQFEENIWAHLI